MSEAFLGELRLMAFGYAPKGWAQCNGQLLPINQNQALFSLMGTMYGGDGQTVFALPDLRGRVPLHKGPSITQGTKAGEELHTLTVSEMPTHLHQLNADASDADDVNTPSNRLAAFNNGYRGATNLAAIHASTVSNVGGSQPHENRQPFLVMNYCVALQGIFPSQN
jgi:microcystin-dependent protein